MLRYHILFYRREQFRSLLLAWLLVALVISPLGGIHQLQTARAAPLGTGYNAPPRIIGTVITIGGLLIAAKLIKDRIDDTISKVDEAAQARLTQARAEVERIIYLIETKYKNMLDVTIDSIDQLAAGQFARAYNLIMTINDELQRVIGVAQQAALAVIEEAARQLRATIDYLFERAEQLVLVAAESGVWVIDNLWETIVSVIALLFLGGCC